MKVLFRFIAILLTVMFVASCATHHPYARAKVKPGKKRTCNCPDFGYNSGKPASAIYFYVNSGDLNNPAN
jgi:hypothetical protein